MFVCCSAQFSRSLLQGSRSRKCILLSSVKYFKRYSTFATVKAKLIDPKKACKEYMLSTSELENLPKHITRSPFTGENNYVVYRIADVEELAMQKHGGREMFDLKKRLMKNWRLDDNRREKLPSNDSEWNRWKEAITSIEGRVVFIAALINGGLFCAKSAAWWLTSSHAMFAECVHSLADTMNQIILFFGVKSSLKKPDEEHPYGFQQMRNISALISGVGIFFFGAGLSFYRGIDGLLHPGEIESVFQGLTVLLGSALFEGVTLAMAFRQTRQDAIGEGYVTFKSYLQYISHGRDPSTTVILLEDCAAIAGVAWAGFCMYASAITGSYVWDCVGSLGVGCLLASISLFIVKTNMETLIGTSIPVERQKVLEEMISNERFIRALYDVKATRIGGEDERFKAEVEFDGIELSKNYLESVCVQDLIQQCNDIRTEADLEKFFTHHGGNIIHSLGDEVNKIEQRVKQKFPNVKHIDLEVN